MREEKINKIEITRDTVARAIGAVSRGQILTVVTNPDDVDQDHILIGDAKSLIGLKKALPVSGSGPAPTTQGPGPLTTKNTVAEIKAELAKREIQIPTGVKTKADLLGLL